MEIRHLRLVEAVNRLGSLTKAAAELHLTQSALSHQLKALESTLGTTLFRRTTTQLFLTAAGREVLETAREVLPRVESVRERIDALGQDELDQYIHGFSPRESRRLYDQAGSIADFIHWDSDWPEGSRVLEAGCGVGAQTRIIATRNPGTEFVSVDLSAKSLAAAAEVVKRLSLTNVTLSEGDLKRLDFPDRSFDHVFVCFVLEHLDNPIQVLRELKRVLRPGGTISVVEGDHGSTYFYPSSKAAEKAVAAQVELQRRRGGNANIGRSLRPLLVEAGFEEVRVDPRQIYVDATKNKLTQGFIKDTFTAMIEGVRDEVIAQNILTATEMDQGIRDLHRTATGEGTFCYTFFRAWAQRASR